MAKPATGARNAPFSVIGGDVTITGNIDATVDLHIDGKVNGDIKCAALVQGPDMKTYIARQNDKVADGTIRAITADSLIILQEVNDPLSLTKQREVPKTLRALEGVK